MVDADAQRGYVSSAGWGGGTHLSLGCVHLAVRPPHHLTAPETSPEVAPSQWVTHKCTPCQGELAQLGREKGQRSLEKDGRNPHRRHASDLAGFWEHPALVYIAPRQGLRQEVWIAS